MRIAIATCEKPPAPDADAELLRPLLQRLGAEAEMVAWTDQGADWSGYDLVWVSSTWDYHERLEEFRAWLRAVEGVTRMENPKAQIEWNLDKSYLRELGEAGVPTVPTIWASPRAEGLAEEVSASGWDRIVVKPTVDLGAMNLSLVAPSEAPTAVDAVGAPCLVQPYLPSLSDEGELSLLYMRGEISHAVRKTPAEGDFRVQERYGGVYSEAEAPPEALEIGTATLEALTSLSPAGGGQPLYARVDLVRGLDGELCLIELELIEPALFLGQAGPDATERFASLLAA